MSLQHRLNRILRQPSYIFGRFLIIRLAYSYFKRILPLSSSKFLDVLDNDKSIFSKLNIDYAVKDIQMNAVAFSFDLPKDMVAEIQVFAANCELKACGLQYAFNYGDVNKGELPDGSVVAIGYAIEPEKCQAIKKVLDDPLLLQAVKKYLGYRPSDYEVRLYYSFVSDLTNQERRTRNQTIDYHFDVHGLNFCYAHFYITDTDKDSGAHVLIKGSHKDKPIKYLLGSARKSDTEIGEYYDRDKILLIEGKAGTGFLEDTSCYHKALAPVSQDRLLLQIRFF